MIENLLFPGKLVPLIAFLVIMGSNYLVINFAEKGKIPTIKYLPGFDAISEAAGRAVELGKGVHYTTGISSFVGWSAESSGAIAAGLSLLSHISDLCLELGTNLMVSCPYPEMLTIQSEILKTSYTKAGIGDSYTEVDHLRYIPVCGAGGPYAAGVSGYLKRERPAANFLLGSFAFEALPISEVGHQVGCFQVGGTIDAGYTAFFIACCDYVLIGEELYAVAALASGDPIQTASLRGNDINRSWVVALIVIGVIATLLGMKTALMNLLSI